ncbi:MAG: glutamate synthase subunit alpha, partial [Bacillota bacterium]
MVKAIGIPDEEGLYSPEQEKDSCGVGFIAHKYGTKSHQVVEQGLEILIRLAHRGAVGADPETGDGAGISLQMPDKFIRKVMQGEGVDLPALGSYGVGMLFLPQDEEERQQVMDLIEKIVIEEGQEVLGWRDVPVDITKIGENAASKAPYIKQLVIKQGSDIDNFELELFFIRRTIEKLVAKLDLEEQELFNITSFSSKVLIYKGLLLAEQISEFYLDLKDEAMQSGFALVHQRYSTNTFPSWDLAQPFKYLAHNGEINTLRGNINWMAAREPSLKSDVLGDRINKVFPITDDNDSDSANLNSVVELMVASGMDVVEAMTILIPEAWSKNEFLDQQVKDYYEYNSSLMEPWDGPAAIGFTDGEQIGAKLDR